MADLQSRLEAWATEMGYKIIRQERPANAQVRHRFFAWLFSPVDSVWVFDLYTRSFRGTVPSGSTCVVIEDRDRNVRRGRMQYIASMLGGFWWSVDSQWTEDDDVPHPLEVMTTEPQEHPLWDSWTDSSRAG